MVSFTCESCYCVLKKSQVDKHCVGKCRNAWGFTCVECGKTFEGYDYKDHNECMTEVQKYQGQFLAKKRQEKQEQKGVEKAAKKEAKTETAEAEDEIESKVAEDKASESSLKGHLGDNGKFLGWKKTAISLIKEKGTKMKKKKLIKKLWKVYKESQDYKELSLD